MQPVAATVRAGRPSSWRLGALVAVWSRAAPRGRLARAGRAYVWGMAVTEAMVMLFWTLRADRASALAVVPDALAALSFPAGLLSLGLAADAHPGVAASTSAFAAEHGSPRVAAEAARWIAAMRAVATTFVPASLAVALLAVATAPGFREAGRAVPLLGFAGLYSAVASVLLGGLARACAAVSPAHPRLLFLGATLGPAMIGAPGVVAALAWLVRHAPGSAG